MGGLLSKASAVPLLYMAQARQRELQGSVAPFAFGRGEPAW